MNPHDDELERLRAAFAAGAEDAAPGASCPEPGLLLSARRHELAPETVRTLVAHTAACGACAEAWRLAGEVNRLLPEPAVALPARRSRPWWGGWPATLASAAALALALGALLGEREPAPGYREVAGPVLRSLVPEDRPLPRQACVLRWTAGPAGSRYSVEVAREDLVPVASARGLDATEYRVPPESLAAIPKGATVLWRVEAVLPGSGRLESVTFLARLE